ncbi:GNAT family N-acetyltransferase [Maritalea sp.]|jgi:phosphinothricin acetyltransferase|uniref:GNAT family N-acetyltransferase n=1 Tax=Maritalea sp. TaxID=2003361 RepID=UPI0039E521A4
MQIAPFQLTNLSAVTDLYAHYVKTTAITFDLEPPTIDQMREKLELLQDRKYPVLVALSALNQVLGFAYASAYRPKQAYKHTSEVTIYVQPNAHGQGIGGALMQNLLATLDVNPDFHLAIAMIADDAKASIGLHKKFGFKDVGYLEEVGHKFGKWHGVTIMQRRV